MTTVNLTKLAETRAKMTPGKYEVIENLRGGDMESERLVSSARERVAVMVDYGVNRRPDENADGIVATHNAADVLIEVARAAKTWLAADGLGHAEFVAMRDALAKVSL